MWSESSVKRQISSIKTRCKTQDEYKQQCYTLARLCQKGGLHNDALLHLRDYISVKPNDYRAHKLMGDIYSAINQHEIALACYKKCIQLKPNQVDVINKVASIYCNMPETNLEDLKEVVARLQSVNPKDPLIDKLTEISIDSSKISTIKYLLNTNKIEEAYDVCQRFYRHSNWNDFIDQSHLLLITVYEKYLAALNQSGVAIERVLSVQLRLMEILCMSCDIELRNVCHRGYNISTPLVLLIEKLDCCLHGVKQYLTNVLSSLSSPLIEVKFNELIGQLYYQISQCLFACHSTNYHYWQLGVVCVLCSLLQPIINESSGNCLSQVDKSDFDYWLKRSQSRHTVLASQLKLISIQDGPQSIIKAIEVFSTSSSKQVAIKMIFADTMSSTNRSYNLMKSYIAIDNSMIDPLLSSLVQSVELDTNNTRFISCYGCDLSAIVWLCTIYKALDTDIPYNDWISCMFPSLSLSPSIEVITKNVSSSFCKCDVEALLILAVYHCHKLMNITKTTPSSSVISGCVVWPQLKVPEEIIKMWKNIHENVNDVSVIEGITRQKFLSVTLQHIRACNPVTLSNNELITLAGHFKQRASDESIVLKDVKILSEWSCHYWKVILDLSGNIHVPSNRIATARRLSTEKSTRGRSPLINKKLFSTHLGNDTDIDSNIANEAAMYIASHYALSPGEEDKALVLYDQLGTYQAAYNTSQIYLRLSEDIEPVFRLRFLDKALQAIGVANKRAKEIGNEKVMDTLERQQDSLRQLVGDYRSTSSFSTIATPSQKSFHPSLSMAASTPTDSIDKDLKIASMEKKLKHLEDQIIELKFLQKTPSLKGQTSPSNRSFSPGQSSSPSYQVQVSYSPQMMYSNNIQSRGVSFQGSPNLLIQSTPPQQQYSPMYGIASPQTRMYTPPERFSTPFSTTYHPGAMQTAPLRMMGNVQGTPLGMMGNVQGTPPGMLGNVQGTPPGMMGNVQGTPPRLGNVQGTPLGMMGNVQGTPPRMMGNVQGTPPRLGNVQGTPLGMMGNVQGTPPRMMGNVQGTPPRMLGNVQGTPPRMMGNVQGTPPRMMGNTLPGMMGATPPMHLAQNIGTRFMSPTMQYGNTSPLIHSTIPTQTIPRGSLPFSISQYGSASNPTTINTTQPIGITFTAINFIPQAQTKPSICSVTTGVSIQQPLVGNYRAPLLGNTPLLKNTAPLSSTPLFNQTLTLSSTAPPLSTSVPVFCQAPLSTSVPVFCQAPLSTSVPVFCQAPLSTSVPVFCQAPLSTSVPVFCQAPLSTSVPVFCQVPLTTSVPVFCQAPSLLSNAPLLSFPFVSQQQSTFQFGTLSSEKSKFTFSSQSTPLFTPLESSDFSPPSAKQPTAKISSIHKNKDPIVPQQYPFSVTSTPLLTTPSVSLAANNTSTTSNNSSGSIGCKPFDSSNTVTGYSITPSLPFKGFNTTSANNTTTSSSLKPLPTSSSSIPSLFMSMPTTSNNTTATSSVFPPFNLFSLTGATPSLVPNTTSTTSFSLLKQPTNTITITSIPSFPPVSLHSDTSPPASPDTSNHNVKSPDVSFEFQPIVSLPEIIQPKSGEEEETELFSDHAKLYRFDKSQWKERGTGIVKILRNETTSKARIVMRRDQILKICCNHVITQDMELKPYGSTDDRWMWFTLCDYTDGIGKPEKLVIKFHKQPNVAKKFKDVFNETKQPSVQDQSSDADDTTSKQSNKQDNMFITKPSTNWECSECWVSNEESSTECVACQTSKPGTKPLVSGITPSGMGLGIGPSSGFSPGGFKLGTTQLVSSGVSGGFNITGLNLGSLGKSLVGGASSSILMTDSIFKGSNESQPQISGIKIGMSQEKQDDDDDGESDEDTIGSVTDTDEDSDNGDESVEESSQTSSNNKCQPLTSQPTIPSQPLTSQPSTTIPSQPNATMLSQPLASKPDVSQPLTSQPDVSQPLTSQPDVSQPLTSQPTTPSLHVPLTSQASVTIPSQTLTSKPDVSQPLTSQPSTTIPSQPNATMLSQPLDLTVTTTCTSMSFSIAKPSFNFSSSLASSPFINSNLQSKLSTASSVNNSPLDTTTVASSFADLSKGFQFNPTIIKSNHDDNVDSDDNDTITETSYDDIKVAPLVSLPKVAVSTGEENEKECFNSHAELYRMVNGDWKERGCGEIKILCNNTTNNCRIIMRRDQTLKLCCNHYLYPYMKLVPHGDKGMNWVWHTKGDLSEDSQKEETLLVRFQSVEVSSSFKECFEKMTSEESETTPTLEDNDVIFVKEELPSDELISKAVSLLLPKSFYNYLNKPSCPGCIGCIEQDNEHNTDLIEKQQSIMADTAPDNSDTTPNNSEIILYNSNTSPDNSDTMPNNHETTPKSTPTIIPFGKASTGLLSFSELSVMEPVFKQKADSTFSFTGTGQQLFRSPQVDGANDDDYNPEEETTVNFKPLVTLPETYTYQTEEEENNVLFEARGKLYRYDGKSQQWKERGIGNMRLLEYPKSGRYRVLMRRDQIFKICCNHYITPDMRISHHFGNEKALMWTTLCDYSEEMPRPEKLALKFGKAETAKAFMKEFVDCVCMLKDRAQDSTQSMNNDDNDEGEYQEEGAKNDDNCDNCDALSPINKQQTPPPDNKENVNNTYSDNPKAIDDHNVSIATDSDKGGQVPGKEITEQDVIIDNLSQSSMPELVDNTPNNSQEQ